MILRMQFSLITCTKQKQFDETLFNKKIVHGTQTTAKAETACFTTDSTASLAPASVHKSRENYFLRSQMHFACYRDLNGFHLAILYFKASLQISQFFSTPDYSSYFL